MRQIRIDPNVRVNSNDTYVGLEDAPWLSGPFGPSYVGDFVEVVIPETDLAGIGCVRSFDEEKKLVYIAVMWDSLKPRRNND